MAAQQANILGFSLPAALASSPFAIRIQRELDCLIREPLHGISVEQDAIDPCQLRAIITGPEGTPYEGGEFRLDLYLTPTYPADPLLVRFSTKVFHPNVDDNGRICLENDWHVIMTLQKVLLHTQALLGSPDPDEPLNQIAAHLWKSNKAKAVGIAREWTRKYAVDIRGDIMVNHIVDKMKCI